MPLYCSKCGTKLPENAKFCMKCGSPVKRAAEPSCDDVNAHGAAAVGKKVGWFAAHKVALISAAVTVVVAGAVAIGGYAIVSSNSGAGDSGQQAASTSQSASSSQESTSSESTQQQSTSDKATQQKSPSKKEIYQKKVAAAKKSGATVYEGTLRVMKNGELLDFQVAHGEIEKSSAQAGKKIIAQTGMKRILIVLVLDKKTTVTAEENGTGYAVKEKMRDIVIDTEESPWKSYAGKRVAVKAKASEGVFPSEISPLGMAPLFNLTVADNLVASY
ncbi:MAG: zinc ribbon domain-containing protein [Coriobacteriales bacterium]|jgi:hypothetical protein